MSLLEPKSWVTDIFLLILLASLVVVFVRWQPGLAGLTFGILGLRVAGYLGREFRFETLGDVAREMSRVHSTRSRRNAGTFNRKEIDALIRDCFCERLLMSPEALR